jgi:glycosyltransferase involved in cell wall biosynthesis
MEKVSIVIPCYNQAHFLPDAIESAINQTYKDIEIIVVNDGSNDSTSEVAKRYKEVRLIEKENGHLSSARNAGIKAAKGTLILPDRKSVV